MKPILAALILTVTLSPRVGAQDIRSKVGPTPTNSINNIIDPDKSVYGMQWGAGEDEFIGIFGPPTGYIRISPSETAMIYGKDHAFIFAASKLSGVRITGSLLDQALSKPMVTRTPFDGIRWQLQNGIRVQMNLADVKKIVGSSLRTEYGSIHNQYFNSDKARIDLNFAHHSGEGEKDEAYRLHGVYIRLGAPASEQTPMAPTRPLQSGIPEATQPCTEEVAKWWEEVRTALKDVVDAARRGDRRAPAAKEKYSRLLLEGEAKSYRIPFEDRPFIILYFARPAYTEQARRNKTSGTVRVRFELRSDGAIGAGMTIINGLADGLDDEAIRAMNQTIFLPSVKDGKFVTTWTTAEADFNLR